MWIVYTLSIKVLTNYFMAKKETKVVEEGNIIVHSNGEEVKRFASVTEAYAFASANGYSVEVR